MRVGQRPRAVCLSARRAPAFPLRLSADPNFTRRAQLGGWSHPFFQGIDLAAAMTFVVPRPGWTFQ